MFPLVLGWFLHTQHIFLNMFIVHVRTPRKKEEAKIEEGWENKPSKRFL